MLSTKMEEALNGQINKEMFSAYLYMAMSAHANSIGLKGFANWFMVQYHEEMVHAMKIYEHVLSRGGTPRLLALKEPPSKWSSPLDMFQKTLEHEQFITRSISDLMELAIAEKDHASRIFLQWYVTEQVEEEENDNEIIAQLKLVKESPQALMMLDKDLSARVMTGPTDFSKGVEAQMGTAA